MYVCKLGKYVIQYVDSTSFTLLICTYVCTCCSHVITVCVCTWEGYLRTYIHTYICRCVVIPDTDLYIIPNEVCSAEVEEDRGVNEREALMKQLGAHHTVPRLHTRKTPNSLMHVHTYVRMCAYTYGIQTQLCYSLHRSVQSSESYAHCTHCIHMHTYVCTYMHIIHVHRHACMSVRMYIYVCTYILMHIHVHRNCLSPPPPPP